MWIPGVFEAPSDSGRRQKSACLGVEGGEDRVVADAPEPIAGVPVIWFDPMSDGVPIASFASWDLLRDLVT